jgi:hypothetical protein
MAEDKLPKRMATLAKTSLAAFLERLEQCMAESEL